MTFKPRLSLPEKNNPYYNTKASGGYSSAIVGKPNVMGLDVLANCVGWAYGRFHEIAGDKKMSLLCPVNAELFIDYANKKLKVGTEAKLGACMVWQRGATKRGDDGCGHVAIVEKINPDGSIVTSESGWNNNKIFWTTTRTNKNGRWGESSEYKFLGFIYQPVDVVPTDTGAEKVKLPKDSDVFRTAQNAIDNCYPVVKYKAGEYYIYKVSGLATNITRNEGKAGGWIATNKLTKQ